MLGQEYEAYLAACNRRDWSAVTRYFDPHVVVDGRGRTVQSYVNELVRTCADHPDHRWTVVDLRQAGDIVTACLSTDRSGEPGVEFVQYRSVNDAIVEVWSSTSLASR